MWFEMDDECIQNCDDSIWEDIDDVTDACDDILYECLSECPEEDLAQIEAFANMSEDEQEANAEDFCEWWLNLDDDGCADTCSDYVWEGLDEITDGCLEILTPDCMMDCPDDNLEVLWEFALLDEDDQ